MAVNYTASLKNIKEIVEPLRAMPDDKKAFELITELRKLANKRHCFSPKTLRRFLNLSIVATRLIFPKRLKG